MKRASLKKGKQVGSVVEKVCLGDDRLDQRVEGICCSPDDKIVGIILNPNF